MKVTTCVSKEYSEMVSELEELQANHSRLIEEERKKNIKAFFAMLEKKYKYLNDYCPLISDGEFYYL